MQINTNDLSLNKKLALYFSGPFVNILIMLLSLGFHLVFKEKKDLGYDVNSLYYINNLLKTGYFYNIFYDIAYINIFLSLINLLPIMPLDGGNVLKSVLEKYIKRKYIYIITLSFNIIFLIIVVYCYYNSFNIVYLAISFMALRGIIHEKNLILEEKLKNTYRKFM